MVSALGLQSSGPGFEPRSDHQLDLFLSDPEFNSSATLVNSQLVASCQLGFLTLLCSVWIICFKLFKWSACKLARAAKCTSTINKAFTFFYNFFLQRAQLKAQSEETRANGIATFVI